MRMTIKVCLVSVFVLISAFLPTSLRALDIWKFDKMADEDQGAYVGSLVEGAENVLKNDGRTADVQKVHELFSTTLPGDKLTVGMTQFEINLARARLVDAKAVAQNHDAQRLEVEHVIIMTLKNNGIVLPKSFMTVGKGFKPKHPPQNDR